MQHATVHPSHPILALAVSSREVPATRQPRPVAHALHLIASAVHPPNSTKPVWVDADCHKNLCPSGDCKKLTSNYRKWAMILHPDKNHSSAMAAASFAKLGACKDRLQNESAHAGSPDGPSRLATATPHLTGTHASSTEVFHPVPGHRFEGIPPPPQELPDPSPMESQLHSTASPPRSCHARELLRLWKILVESYKANRDSETCEATDSAMTDLCEKVKEDMEVIL